MNQKLNRLMPRLLADRHEDLILNFVNGNRRINKENHNFVWGRHKNNFIFPLIMDINAYVNFEFNFCFIAFLKRSVLLEFQPIRESMETSEVFVMQTTPDGVIEDMTQNMSDYLNFPIQVLQKDINVSQFFKGIEDDSEQSFSNGKKILDFDPSIFRRVIEQEDIDVLDKNHLPNALDGSAGDLDFIGHPGGGGDFLDPLGQSPGGTSSNNNLNLMSDKKWFAHVWLRHFDYLDQDVMLQYKEVWFLLMEQDDTVTNMDSGKYVSDCMRDGNAGGVAAATTNEDKGDMKMNMTYTDDREEICSIASMSSLANYDKNRKSIMAKLSEIKTQTIDD